MLRAGVLLLAAAVLPCWASRRPRQRGARTPHADRADRGRVLRPQRRPDRGRHPGGRDAAGEEGYWLESAPVPCTAPHTFEVTESGLLPMDVNAFAFAARAVRRPRRVERRRREPPGGRDRRGPAAHRAAGATPCGSRRRATCAGRSPCRCDGRRPPTAVSLTSSIERLGRRARAALRYCSSAADGRSADRAAGDGAVLDPAAMAGRRRGCCGPPSTTPTPGGRC